MRLSAFFLLSIASGGCATTSLSPETEPAATTKRILGSIENPGSVSFTTNKKVWRKVFHEGWGRASASSLMGLFSTYSHPHLQSGEGNVAIRFRASAIDRAVDHYSGTATTKAELHIGGIADDSISAQRWIGLARFADGIWYLEELWFSQKCARGVNIGKWTSQPCP